MSPSNDAPRIIQIVLPAHTSEKLDQLCEHYMLPPDMLIQKYTIDRIDDMIEAVILEPQRKEAHL